jgi:hypothetical protein
MAAGSTYTPISSQTLSSSASSIDFTSIPQTYTDLVLVYSAKSTSTASDVTARFNDDSGSNYSHTVLYGTGTSANSGRGSNQTRAFLDATGYISNSVFNIAIININNYSNSTTYKTTLGRSNNPASDAEGVDMTTTTWRNTNPITKISIIPYSAVNFATGSTFTIYGITAA